MVSSTAPLLIFKEGNEFAPASPKGQAGAKKGVVSALRLRSG